MVILVQICGSTKSPGEDLNSIVIQLRFRLKQLFWFCSMEPVYMVGRNFNSGLDIGQSNPAGIFLKPGNSCVTDQVIDDSYRLFHWDTPRRVINFCTIPSLTAPTTAPFFLIRAWCKSSLPEVKSVNVVAGIGKCRGFHTFQLYSTRRFR